MSWSPSASLVHLVIGIVVIAANVILAVTHVIDGQAAITLLTGVAGILLGTTAASVGNAQAVQAMNSQPPSTVPGPGS